MNERESLNLTQSEYRTYRKILNRVTKDRVRGRLSSEEEWPTWDQIRTMALDVVRSHRTAAGPEAPGE